jgi:hypothetical protein
MTAFLTSAREQRKGNWNDALKATSVNNWIGAGFNFTFN